MSEKTSMTIGDAFEEASHYSSSQRRAFIEELDTDVQNLARSMSALYDEHAGIFLLYGVQVEVKFSVFNEVAYRQLLGCPELYTQLAEKAKVLKEASEMAKALKEVFDDQRAKTGD